MLEEQLLLIGNVLPRAEPWLSWLGSVTPPVFQSSLCLWHVQIAPFSLDSPQ